MNKKKKIIEQQSFLPLYFTRFLHKFKFNATVAKHSITSKYVTRLYTFHSEASMKQRQRREKTRNQTKLLNINKTVQTKKKLPDFQANYFGSCVHRFIGFEDIPIRRRMCNHLNLQSC